MTTYPTYITPDIARWIDQSTLKSTHGRLNIYTCDNVDGMHQTMTVDLDVGATPMMIRCPRCDAMATSAFYHVVPRQTLNMKPTIAWYRPDSLDGLSEGRADHVLNGGLCQRPLTTDEQELLS